MQREIRLAQALTPAELYGYAKKLGVSVDLLQRTAELGRLPVVNFAAGGLGKEVWLSLSLSFSLTLTLSLTLSLSLSHSLSHSLSLILPPSLQQRQRTFLF